MLEKAMILAAKGHMGQLDKGGHPYILHPIRVMLQCRTIEEKTVAMLHDLLEDTEYTEDDLRKEGFSEDVIAAVVCLTKTEGEEYTDYVERICQNKLAARVKLADLMDKVPFIQRKFHLYHLFSDKTVTDFINTTHRRRTISNAENKTR